jgi:hypothetical protein
MKDEHGRLTGALSQSRTHETGLSAFIRVHLRRKFLACGAGSVCAVRRVGMSGLGSLD